MKKIFLTALILLMVSAGTANAVTPTVAQQIQALQQEIARLQALLAEMGPAQPQNISAESYLVVDISNNSVVFQKNASKAYPIASVTKLMNAVVTLENVDMSQSITLTEPMLKPDGGSPALFLGLKVSANNLLKAMLIQSTNDAAESLTYFLGRAKFISLMNKKAQELGMKNTHYYDPHGLNPKNHSTVSDLAKLLAYIYKNHPEILEITKVNGFQLPSPTGELLTFKNLNAFSENPDFIGGKSGYLPEAKQSMASLFNINGKTIAVVVLKSTDRKADTLQLIDQFKNR